MVSRRAVRVTVDGAVALVLVVVAVVSTIDRQELPHPWTGMVVALWMASLAARTSAPLVTVAGGTCGAVVYAALGAESTPLWSFVALLLAGFSVGVNLDGARRIAAGLALLASVYVLQVATIGGTEGFAEVYLSPLVLVSAPVLAGALLRRSRERTERLDQLTAELAEQHRRNLDEALRQERLRIARELHDVISHSVSSMVVQAGAAGRLVGPADRVGAELRTIRETGRQALTELRRQLGILRDAAPAEDSVLPGLSELPALAERAGAAYRVAGTPVALAPGLALTVYRVVQEGLANAQRHARGAAVQVCLSYDEDRVEVTVSDSGGSASPVDGTGYGLRGVAERVALYGGRCTSGPDDGGWRLSAVLPLEVVPR